MCTTLGRLSCVPGRNRPHHRYLTVFCSTTPPSPANTKVSSGWKRLSSWPCSGTCTRRNPAQPSEPPSSHSSLALNVRRRRVTHLHILPEEDADGVLAIATQPLHRRVEQLQQRRRLCRRQRR